VTTGASTLLHGISPIVEISDSVELRLALSVQHLKPGLQIALREATNPEPGLIGAFMLRIERSANGQVEFTLSGRMQTEDIEQVQQLLIVETSGQPVMFDLRDVTLVNQEAVTFLADCEAKGIKLESCPLHIRNWIDQEKRRDKRRQRQRRDS
jgi:hypothetical protein